MWVGRQISQDQRDLITGVIGASCGTALWSHTCPRDNNKTETNWSRQIRKWFIYRFSVWACLIWSSWTSGLVLWWSCVSVCKFQRLGTGRTGYRVLHGYNGFLFEDKSSLIQAQIQGFVGGGLWTRKSQPSPFFIIKSCFGTFCTFWGWPPWIDSYGTPMQACGPLEAPQRANFVHVYWQVVNFLSLPVGPLFCSLSLSNS